MSIQETVDKFQRKERFDQHIDAIESHLNRHFKSAEITVFHELVSLDFHLDVYYVQPKGREYDLLVTCGMSLFEMNVDPAVGDRSVYCFSELMVLLPKTLKLEKVHTGREPHGWILSMLKQSARFPHHYDTYLAVGHTLQATADMKPYTDETKFVGCMVLPSVTFKEDFTEVRCENRLINIYGLFPLYEAELKYKIDHGYNAFVDKLQEGNPKELINNNRKSLVGGSGLLDFFKRR